jgi:hypothetical protein
VNSGLVAERQILLDPIHVGLVNKNRTAQAPTPFSALALAEVTATGLITQDFAAGRDLESLGHRFLSLDTFRTSHKLCFFPKEGAV